MPRRETPLVARRWSLRRRGGAAPPTSNPLTAPSKQVPTERRSSLRKRRGESSASPAKRQAVTSLRRSTRGHVALRAGERGEEDGGMVGDGNDSEAVESAAETVLRRSSRSRKPDQKFASSPAEDEEEEEEEEEVEEADEDDSVDDGRRHSRRERKPVVRMNISNFQGDEDESSSEEEDESSSEEEDPRQSRRTRKPVVRMNIQALGKGSGSPAASQREPRGFERTLRRAESRFDAERRARNGPPVYKYDHLDARDRHHRRPAAKKKKRSHARAHRRNRDHDEYRHRSFGGGDSSTSDDDSNMARAFGGRVAPSPGKRHRIRDAAPRAINDGASGSAGDALRADAAPLEIDKSITWSSIGGLDHHIDSLKEMVLLPLLYPEAFTRFGIQPPRGVLFYGPPGTGKTLMARALVNECSVGDTKVSFFMRKGADVLSKWAGEAEKQLRLLFDEARKRQPAIIFFDEIDGLAPVRSSKQDQHHSSIVSTLLALMDGLDSRGQVVVIGATNRIDSIDPALRRPGRFDRELAFSLPTRAARESILAIATAAWTPPLSSLFVRELARQTVGYCGADLKSLCSEAAIGALRRNFPLIYKSTEKLVIDPHAVRVTASDFTTAMVSVTPASQRNASTFAAPLSSTSAKYAVLSAALDGFRATLAAGARGLAPPAVATTAAASSSSSSSAATPSEAAASAAAAPAAAAPAAAAAAAAASVGEEDPEEPLLLAAVYEEPSSEKDEARFLDSVRRVFARQPGEGSGMRGGARARSQRAHVQRRQTRALFCGDPGNGQEALAAAVLHSLEDLPTYPLDLPGYAFIRDLDVVAASCSFFCLLTYYFVCSPTTRLIADAAHSNAAEACIMRLRSAQRSAPSVVYLPFAAAWWMEAGDAMRSALRMALRSIPAACPLVFLAMADLPMDEMDPALVRLILPCEQRPAPFALLDEVVQHVHHLAPPSREQRAVRFSALNAQPPRAAKRYHGPDASRACPARAVLQRAPSLHRRARSPRVASPCSRALSLARALSHAHAHSPSLPPRQCYYRSKRASPPRGRRTRTRRRQRTPQRSSARSESARAECVARPRRSSSRRRSRRSIR